METPTHEQVKEFFDYNPLTGVLLWRRCPIKNKTVQPGDVAGSLFEGYRFVTFRQKRLAVHRLAWFYIFGAWPDSMLDHVNGVKDDNRIENLRLASNAQNQYNRKANSKNTSGAKNVYWLKKKQRWRVAFEISGKSVYFGTFKDLNSATKAAIIGREIHHSEFANHG